MTFTLARLKRVKNTVIGNPAAKQELAQDTESVARLVECLNGSAEAQVRMEAAHVIASIAHADEGSLLRADAPRALLYALSAAGEEQPAALRAALARGLRSLGMALADTVGPSEWGLREERAGLGREAEAALEYLFETEAMDVYLPLLQDVASQKFVLQLVAFSIRTGSHRAAVVDWQPAEERMKSRRGWEKAESWVCGKVTVLTESKDVQVQEAALWALATIAKDNAAVAVAVSKSAVLRLVKSRSTDMQLAACMCLTSIIRASSSAAASSTSSRTLINVLHRIIQHDTPAARTKAAFILFYLLTDNPALALTAFDLGTLRVLAAALHALPPTFDDPEPVPAAALREALLTALAALALFDNSIRRALADSGILPLILASLNHPRTGVRYAAAQCVRALSRAVAVLRTNIVDSGLGMAVFHLFLKTDQDKRVTAAALAAVCNIVNEFSPLRPIYLDQGLMPRLVQLLSTPSTDPTLRLSSLWAVKNLLSKSSNETKRDVMAHLGWPRLSLLLQDPDTAIQEQALHLVRNLAENESGVDLVFRSLDPEMLLRTLTRALGAPDDDLVLQATYTLANLANGPPPSSSSSSSTSYAAHPLLASPASPHLLLALRTALAERTPPIRRPAVSAVLELARASTAARRALADAGIARTLRAICAADADDRDVAELARTALDWLEHGEAYR